MHSICELTMIQECIKFLEKRLNNAFNDIFSFFDDFLCSDSPVFVYVGLLLLFRNESNDPRDHTTTHYHQRTTVYWGDSPGEIFWFDSAVFLFHTAHNKDPFYKNHQYN